MIFFLTRLRGVVRRADSFHLAWWTVAHFLLFWWVMAWAEGGRIAEPANFWYFWATTVLTIGYGDLSPSTTEARLLAPLFEFTGVLLLTAWLAKAGLHLTKRYHDRKRGIMRYDYEGHVIVLGDYSPVRSTQIVSNVRVDDPRTPVVCAFRNTGDHDPEIPGTEYYQVREPSPGTRTLEDLNAWAASKIFVNMEDDMAAIGVVCALSRRDTRARVALMLRDPDNQALIPHLALDVNVILPMQAVMAVRELKDTGVACVIGDLLDMTRSQNVYRTSTSYSGRWGDLRGAFEVGHRDSLLLGWVDDADSHVNPAPDDQAEGRLVYIARRRLADAEELELSRLTALQR